MESEEKTSIKKTFEILDHPADIRIRAFGVTKKELFCNVANGMIYILFGDLKKKCTETSQKETIRIQGVDEEALIVEWLSELLYRVDKNNAAYTNIHITSLTENELEATITRCDITAKDEIKAVTYHGLEIIKRDNLWEAIILFDV